MTTTTTRPTAPARATRAPDGRLDHRADDLRLGRMEDRAEAGQTPAPCRASTGELVVAGMAVLGATAVGLRWASRPSGVRTITMGHGGWVSFKGTTPPPPPTTRRPWWAAALRAQPLSGRPAARRSARRQ